MRALFSPDSRFMRIMSRVGDLMVLNLLFLLACVPVITIGAAASALYTVCFRCGTEREGRLIRTYFRVFREDFIRSTVLWLIVLVCGGAAGLNTYVFYLMPGALRWAFVLFAILFVLVVLTAGYIFPLVSQFGSGVGYTCKNALIFGLGYLPRSVLIAAFNVFPFGMLFLDFYQFLQMGFLWAALYFSAAAYVNSMLMKKVFAPYLSEQAEEKENLL